MSCAIAYANRQHVVVTVLFALVLCFVVSCNRPLSKEALVGSYRLSSNAGFIDLELVADGSLVESIHAKSGTVTIRKGKWTLPSGAYSQIGLDGLWVPSDFAPDYINRADKYAGSGPKYTELGYWVITPIYEFGRIVLPIFPDSDIEFVRVPTPGHQ